MTEGSASSGVGVTAAATGKNRCWP